MNDFHSTEKYNIGKVETANIQDPQKKKRPSMFLVEHLLWGICNRWDQPWCACAEAARRLLCHSVLRKEWSTWTWSLQRRLAPEKRGSLPFASRSGKPRSLEAAPCLPHEASNRSSISPFVASFLHWQSNLLMMVLLHFQGRGCRSVQLGLEKGDNFPIAILWFDPIRESAPSWHGRWRTTLLQTSQVVASPSSRDTSRHLRAVRMWNKQLEKNCSRWRKWHV